MGHFPAPFTVSWGPSRGCIQLVAKVGWKVPEGFPPTSVPLRSSMCHHGLTWASLQHGGLRGVGFLT